MKNSNRSSEKERSKRGRVLGKEIKEEMDSKLGPAGGQGLKRHQERSCISGVIRFITE